MLLPVASDVTVNDITHMYMYINICTTYVYQIRTIEMHTRTYVCMYICMYVRAYVYMYACMYVHMYVCTYVCMYVRTYVRMHA